MYGKYSVPLFEKEGLGEILLDNPLGPLAMLSPFFKGGEHSEGAWIITMTKYQEVLAQLNQTPQKCLVIGVAGFTCQRQTFRDLVYE